MSVLFGSAAGKQQATGARNAMEEILTAQSLTSAIESSGDQLVIVAFVQSFAPPCDTVLDQLKSLSASLGNLKLLKVNVDVATALADANGIEAVPTLRFFVNGTQVHSMTTVSREIIHPFVVKWSKKVIRVDPPS